MKFARAHFKVSMRIKQKKHHVQFGKTADHFCISEMTFKGLANNKLINQKQRFPLAAL